MRAVKAAEKTISRGCFIAIKAAIKKVLSPISEKIIIVSERTKECSGWMRVAEFPVSMGMEGVKGARMVRGSLLEAVAGTGCGRS